MSPGKAVRLLILVVGLVFGGCVDGDEPDPVPDETPMGTDNESEGDCVSDQDCREKFADEIRIENMENFTCRINPGGATFCSECESSNECASGVCTSSRFCDG